MDCMPSGGKHIFTMDDIQHQRMAQGLQRVQAMHAALGKTIDNDPLMVYLLLHHRPVYDELMVIYHHMKMLLAELAPLGSEESDA